MYALIFWWGRLKLVLRYSLHLLSFLNSKTYFTKTKLLQVFDTWASELSPHHYTEFALPYYKLISSRVRSSLLTLNIPCPPLTLFAKGANASLGLTAKESGFDVLSLDWLVSPSVAVSEVSGHVALQGNIDPNVLYGGKEATEREVKRMCEGFKQGGKTKAWIANLGHGITPGVDPEDLKWFLECVHKYSRSDSGDV
jgi:uroporphyrinogen decarboxylase